MSLENPKVVDAIGLDRSSVDVVLTIADALDWSDERRHLLLLQEKLNAYFEFIEGGQIYESYPDARGKGLIIDIVSRFSMPPSAIELLRKASQIALPLNVKITRKQYEGKQGSPDGAQRNPGR